MTRIASLFAGFVIIAAVALPLIQAAAQVAG